MLQISEQSDIEEGAWSEKLLTWNKKLLKQFEMKLVKVLLILLVAMIEILNKF